MKTTGSIEELRLLVWQARLQGQQIGCVPTMGALHAGHVSLIEAAVAQTDFVVVTIFVNPTQFGPQEDFQKYPRPLAKDLELCQQAGAALVFHPEVAEIYGPAPEVKVTVGELANCWEGASRPGHFDGVATVVTKLFNIVQPDSAFFGAKDYQQQAIIKALCRDLNLPVKIITCPTVRSAEGLALSSRNAYLSPEERTAALSLSQALKLAETLVLAGELALPEIRQQMHELLTRHPHVQPDYATIADPVSLRELAEPQAEMVALIAARVGATRLIDNLEIFREKRD